VSAGVRSASLAGDGTNAVEGINGVVIGALSRSNFGVNGFGAGGKTALSAKGLPTLGRSMAINDCAAGGDEWLPNPGCSNNNTCNNSDIASARHSKPELSVEFGAIIKERKYAGKYARKQGVSEYTWPQ
jgi:hypothetical protein